MRLDLSKNNPTDKIKLAASIIPVAASDNTHPDALRVTIDFLNEYTGVPTAYARWQLEKTTFDDNYFIAETDMSSFVIVEPSGSSFSWSNINGIRIHTATYSGASPSPDWYVLYDGLRLENLSEINPLYGLVGYNVIVSDDGQPITKRANTTNYVEYRFDVGVG